jgi:hypothetical protein
VSQKVRSTFVVSEPSEVVQALVGLKDVRVLRYVRRGPEVELVIEQVVIGSSMSWLRRPGAGEGASAGPLRRSACLRHPDAVGLAQAPDALPRPGVPETQLGAR